MMVGGGDTLYSDKRVCVDLILIPLKKQKKTTTKSIIYIQSCIKITHSLKCVYMSLFPNKIYVSHNCTIKIRCTMHMQDVPL